MEARLIEVRAEKHLNGKGFSRVWNIYIYNLWDNQTISNDSDL